MLPIANGQLWLLFGTECNGLATCDVTLRTPNVAYCQWPIMAALIQHSHKTELLLFFPCVISVHVARTALQRLNDKTL